MLLVCLVLLLSADHGCAAANWAEDTSVGATKSWQAITSSADGTKLAATVYDGNIWTSNNNSGAKRRPSAGGLLLRLTMTSQAGSPELWRFRLALACLALAWPGLSLSLACQQQQPPKCQGFLANIGWGFGIYGPSSQCLYLSEGPQGCPWYI